MNVQLYKRSKSGKIQQWQIVVEEGKFLTQEGFVNGMITSSEWTHCEGKSLGTKKETTPEQQAIKEAEAKVKKQREKGYTDTPEEAKVTKVKISPMLAHKYEDYKDKLQNILLGSQPKLDGIRCIATKDGLFTRNGKPITAAPHIWEEVQLILEYIGDDNIKIDGELYNHTLKENFNEITSIVRKSILSQEDLDKSERLLEYHIYDIDIKDMALETRISILESLFEETFEYLVLVKTDFTNQSTVLDDLYGKYLQEGYEGQMVRIGNSMYENSRSKNLLKRKEFMDEEFEITDIEEGLGNRSGMMGRIKFKMKNGKEFDSNARGTYEYFKELLVNKNKYIGKFATVRFQNYTPDGSVRFPVMIDIRNND